jgi:hypothetical protein
LETVQTSVHGISAAIVGDRKIGFWGWDVAGAYGFAAVSALIYLFGIEPPSLLTRPSHAAIEVSSGTIAAAPPLRGP